MSDPTTEGTSTEAPKPGPPPAQNVSDEGQPEPTRLPDDHPLVTAFERQKQENAALKAKVAEFEDANKTEAEKVAERLANAEREAAEAKATVLRLNIALEHKLDETDAALLDKLTDEDAMRALAARLAAAQVEDKTTRPPRPDPNQGRNGAAPTNTADLFAATVSDLIK